MRNVFLIILVSIAAASGFGQGQPATMDLSNYGVKIDADKRLMIVLSALDLAVTKNDAGETVRIINTQLSPQGSKFREQLRQDNAAVSEELKQKISAFVANYKKSHPKKTDEQLLSPFVSMAYALSPAPDLIDPAYSADLPGDLLDVLDFAPLAREYYRRSGIAARLDDYAKKYRAEADGILRVSTREMVSELLDYMHTRPQTIYVEKVKVETQKGKSKNVVLQKTEIREHERKFVVVPEMLAPAGEVTFLNIKDDYFVILPPDKDISYSEARRAFLQFVIDPMILKNAKEIVAIREPIKALVEEQRKSDSNVSPDVFLAVSRSLVAAVDARQTEYSRLQLATSQAREKIARQQTEADKRAVSAELDKIRRSLADDTALSLSEAYERGAVLSFYFSEQLKGTEDSGFDLGASVREMIATFDATKEKDRLAQNRDARKRAQAARDERRNRPVTQETVADNPVTKRLLEIQKTIGAKDYVKANAELQQLKAEYPSEPRIYYSLGRVASLSAESLTDQNAQAAKLLEAQTFYGNVLRKATTDTDPALLSVTYLALARLYEFFNQNGMALQAYDRVIRIGEVKDGGYREAKEGKEALLKKNQ